MSAETIAVDAVAQARGIATELEQRLAAAEELLHRLKEIPISEFSPYLGHRLQMDVAVYFHAEHERLYGPDAFREVTTDCPASSYPPGAASGTLSRRPATSEMSPPCAGRDTAGGTSSLPSWELLHECPTHPAGPCYQQGCLPCSYWSRLAERWQDRALDAEARVQDLDRLPLRSTGATS